MTDPAEFARTRTRVMLVGKDIDQHPGGGREMLSRLNRDALHRIYGDRLMVYTLQPARSRRIAGLLAAHIDGVNTDVLADIVRCVGEAGVTKVFIDGSNLGAVVSALKAGTRGVEVITFFHNVEARFFLGALRVRRTPHAAGVLAANYLAERRAAKGSDKRICLSERDSRLLHRLYRKPASHIAPMAVVDQWRASPHGGGMPEAFALFVGGNFYANRVGIAWYAHHVAADSPVPVVVVGRGFESLRGSLEIPGKLQVVGAVDNLQEWYERAQFVIAPIFDGSGMKTKVAEALMFGKKVVGTPEAFSGYEAVASEAGWLCRNAAEFAQAMRTASRTIVTRFSPASREIYLHLYSSAAAERRLRSILED